MSELSKRSTIYFKPATYRALKLRAESMRTSISELVDDAVRLMMSEAQEDLAAWSERAAEKEISYEALLNDLKKHGKV